MNWYLKTTIDIVPRGINTWILLLIVEQEDDGDTAVQCVDLLRRNGNYKKALELIAEIGETDIEEIDKVLAFEKELIAKKDKTSHFVEEALQK